MRSMSESELQPAVHNLQWRIARTLDRHGVSPKRNGGMVHEIVRRVLDLGEAGAPNEPPSWQVERAVISFLRGKGIGQLTLDFHLDILPEISSDFETPSSSSQRSTARLPSSRVSHVLDPSELLRPADFLFGLLTRA